jgi:hypothetical protein
MERKMGEIFSTSWEDKKFLKDNAAENVERKRTLRRYMRR